MSPIVVVLVIAAVVAVVIFRKQIVNALALNQREAALKADVTKVVDKVEGKPAPAPAVPVSPPEPPKQA